MGYTLQIPRARNRALYEVQLAARVSMGYSLQHPRGRSGCAQYDYAIVAKFQRVIQFNAHAHT